MALQMAERAALCLILVTVFAVSTETRADEPTAATPSAIDSDSADWPQFRGPGGQGQAPAGPLPLTWSETENIAWKTRVPGNGWSSPVIAGNDLWLTTATEAGKALRALRFDCRTGECVVVTKPLF